MLVPEIATHGKIEMQKDSALELMRQLYDSEFCAPGDFGSGFADALAARKAAQAGLNDYSTVDAFKAVVADTPDNERRLRFSALVAGMANPFSPANSGEQRMHLGVYAAASATFGRTLYADPASALRTLTACPENFSVSPQIAAVSLQFLKQQAADMPSSLARHVTLSAARSITLNMQSS